MLSSISRFTHFFSRLQTFFLIFSLLFFFYLFFLSRMPIKQILNLWILYLTFSFNILNLFIFFLLSSRNFSWTCFLIPWINTLHIQFAYYRLLLFIIQQLWFAFPQALSYSQLFSFSWLAVTVFPVYCLYETCCKNISQFFRCSSFLRNSSMWWFRLTPAFENVTSFSIVDDIFYMIIPTEGVLIILLIIMVNV